MKGIPIEQVLNQRNDFGIAQATVKRPHYALDNEADQIHNRAIKVKSPMLETSAGELLRNMQVQCSTVSVQQTYVQLSS